MTDAAAFGQWLRSRRQAAGLSQDELAERSGMSIRAVSNLERGRTGCPHRTSLLRLADALDLQGQVRAEFLAAARRQAPATAPTDMALLSSTWPIVPKQLPLVVPRQLPPAVRDFIGRDAALAELTALLDAARANDAGVVVAAVDGAPGVGKTALAVRWAHQAAAKFPDGQLYINMRGFGPSAEIVPAQTATLRFLDAFGVPSGQVPSSPDSLVALYRSLLAGMRVLIVVDNARDAAQVRPLLPGSPGCMVLVTSRARLTGLAAAEGARLLTLDLLSPGEARGLLARRVGVGRAKAEPDAVDELAWLCGRLPLALTVAAALAAARPGMSLTAVAAELTGAADRLRALETGDPVTDVRTVFSWSCDHLDELPARMFRFLGVHPGPDITVPAAAVLLNVASADARFGLGALAMANLVDEHVPGRFTLHDLLRDYAADQAAEQEPQTERQAAIQRALDFYLHTSHAAALLLDPSREPVTLNSPRPGVMPEPLTSSQQALAWFEAEHRVLMSAIAAAEQTGSDTHAWQLPWAMESFLNWRGHWQEWAAVQRTALAAATRLGDAAGQATARRLLAHTFARTGNYDQARVLLTHCVGLYRQLGDQIGEGRVHQTLGWVAERQNWHADALGHAEKALALYQAAGDQARQAAALNNVGWCLVLAGDYQRARTFCSQAVALHRQLGHRRGEANSLDSLGYAEHKLGNLTQAADCHRRALAIVRELGDRYDEAEFLTHLGDVCHTSGDQPTAENHWQKALDILNDLHHPDAAQLGARLRQHDRLPAVGSPDSHRSATGKLVANSDLLMTSFTSARSPERKLEAPDVETRWGSWGGPATRCVTHGRRAHSR
jgi:tetratricopeptide (TPR) repeat protein/transcriptional regulator with XRE-family HTH domain